MSLLLILYAISFVSGVGLPWWVWAYAWLRVISVFIIAVIAEGNK